MKTIAIFPTHEEALVARSFLASQNIECYLSNDHIQNTIPHLTGKRGYPLMVIDEDLSAARAALETVIDQAHFAEDVAPTPIPWQAVAIIIGLILLAVFIRNIL